MTIDKTKAQGFAGRTRWTRARCSAVIKHKAWSLALPALLVFLLGWQSVILAGCTPLLSSQTSPSPSGDTGQSESGGTNSSNASSDGTGSQSTGQAGLDPAGILQSFAAAWESIDYASMYRLLTASAKAALSDAAFIDRYMSILGSIEAKNIVVTPADPETNPPASADHAVLGFSVTMDTLAGTLDIPNYRMDLIREDIGGRSVWGVDWSVRLVFPDLGETDKVRARVLYPRRGEILDRNGSGLAVNGQLINIGVVPAKFNSVKDEAIPQLSALLGISVEQVGKKLADATNPDWFYPLVTIPGDARDLSAQLTAIAGVQYQNIEGRIYPGGEAIAHLVGYVGAITAEELEKKADSGYTATDKIGKMGLEQVFEERLRGKNGGEIYISEAESSQIKVLLARQDPVHGETITLSIDLPTQQKIYDVMKQDKGAAAAINPVTGEILALVSSPAFNPNLLQTYVPDVVRASWNEPGTTFFTNRFKAGYAPGSVFKLVTAAIGLKNGTLNPDEGLSISGLHWQPDASWGNYQVTRVKDLGHAVTLHDGLLYSDNIYFAMQALRIGRDAFTKYSADFGFGEALPIDYPFYKAQLANQDLNSSVLLADSGFGQGEVQVSTLHIALFYSTLATNGDLMKPVLEIKGAFTPQIWHAQAIKAESVPLLRQALLDVVETPEGTGYTSPGAQTRMLGKTGTAELKKTLEDTEAQENGWFVAMNADSPQLTIAMIIEAVKGRGGSHYVVPLVKQAMDSILIG